MATPFLSSEEYDERAHQLYNEGQYDDALVVLREGLALYPNSVELHIGVGYARLAREEFAWARQSFEEALVLEPEHEDALAGLGETLLKFGLEEAGLRCFRRTLELGYADDQDLMLQIGRALFREGSTRERRELFSASLEFFEVAVQQSPDSAEAVACVGYAQHRLGDDEAAIASLRRSLQVDPDHVEARIYLANILYDRGDYEAALYHFERTGPEDHWDELGIWRLIELKRSAYKLGEHDGELKPWEERLQELGGELDDLDEMFMEIDGGMGEGADVEVARGQLELFGTLLSSLTGTKGENVDPDGDPVHEILTPDGMQLTGSWEEIVVSMKAGDVEALQDRTLSEFMARRAKRVFRETGMRVPHHDVELFIRGHADAGLLRIVR
ncbi:MAG: Tetratricopeptide 1 repeat-containing protein [Gemmatimonadetes bacterium]|jgi:tetratricopeptide (TPR) repeat protein|nr:Tetratricopeptide 1 repeat-containing protein [Gemmatimonadota bacterium]